MPRWSPRPPLDPAARHWLTAPGSLTAHLQSTCEAGFAVQRTRQGASPLRFDERQALPAPAASRAHAREVLLHCDGRPVVYARSVVTAAQVHGAWRSLAGLGTRPLAQLLFQQRHVERTSLGYARLPRCGPLRRHLERAWRDATGEAPPPGPWWARRARYTRQRAPLLLMEVFSPLVLSRRSRLLAAPPGGWRQALKR